MAGTWKGTASTKPRPEGTSGAPEEIPQPTVVRGGLTTVPRVCHEDLADMERQPEGGGTGSAYRELSISLSLRVGLAAPL